MKKLCVAVIMAATLGVVPAYAGMKVTHHVDLLETSRQGLEPMSLGYHLTLFRLGSRVQLLGVGGGLNFPNRTDAAGELAVSWEPFLAVPIADIALRNPAGQWRNDMSYTREQLGKWWPSLGVQYTYDFRTEDWRFSGGLRFSRR